MNTRGHQSIAEDVGYEVLQDIFGKDENWLKVKESRYASYYLGNWITDVSQAIDPVAVKAVNKTTKSGKDLIEEALGNVEEVILKWLNSMIYESSSTESPNDTIYQKFERIVEKALEEASRTVSESATSITQDFKQYINEFIKKLYGQLELVLFDGNEERASELHQALRTALRIKGYFKFAHPLTFQESPVDPDVYFHILIIFLTPKMAYFRNIIPMLI